MQQSLLLKYPKLPFYARICIVKTHKIRAFPCFSLRANGGGLVRLLTQ